jgi:hypothetical protein
MKASRAISLLLIPLGLVFLGYHSCDREEGDDFASTQPSSSSSGYHSSGYHSSYWFGRSTGSSYRSSGSSFSSTSRGGFGSHGGSIGS